MTGFWSIDAGQIGILLGILAAYTSLIRKLDHHMIEHEMMMDWYCRQHNVRKEDLPTRQRTRITSIFRGGI